MKLQNEFQPIRDWAHGKGIYSKGDLKTQTLKLLEEAGELAKAILNNDPLETEDAIGDCTVVLTSIAVLAANHFQTPISIESCTNKVYEAISKRKGRMDNGTFKKE